MLRFSGKSLIPALRLEDKYSIVHLSAIGQVFSVDQEGVGQINRGMSLYASRRPSTRDFKPILGICRHFEL